MVPVVLDWKKGLSGRPPLLLCHSRGHERVMEAAGWSVPRLKQQKNDTVLSKKIALARAAQLPLSDSWSGRS